MQYREFGRSGMQVSCIGLGGSPLGGGLFQQSEAQSLALVRHAFDRGITLFDTSNNYGMGRSESIIGAGLRGHRSEVIIATKGGARFSPTARVALALRPLLRPLRGVLQHHRRSLNLARDAHKHYDYSAAGLRRALEDSLRRLRTDYVDVYQLYNPLAGAPGLDEGFETLERFRQEGKARCVGLSVNRADDAAALLGLWQPDTLQLPLSLLDQQALDGRLEHYASSGIGVIARSVLAQGLLTDARGHLMADESSHFTVEQLRERRTRRHAFEPLVVPGRSIAQAAVQFAIAQRGVASALVAATSIAQLDENLGALTAPPLGEQQLRQARGATAGEPGT